MLVKTAFLDLQRTKMLGTIGASVCLIVLGGDSFAHFTSTCGLTITV